MPRSTSAGPAPHVPGRFVSGEGAPSGEPAGARLARNRPTPPPSVRRSVRSGDGGRCLRVGRPVFAVPSRQAGGRPIGHAGHLHQLSAQRVRRARGASLRPPDRALRRGPRLHGRGYARSERSLRHPDREGHRHRRRDAGADRPELGGAGRPPGPPRRLHPPRDPGRPARRVPARARVPRRRRDARRRHPAGGPAAAGGERRRRAAARRVRARRRSPRRFAGGVRAALGRGHAPRPVGGARPGRLAAVLVGGRWSAAPRRGRRWPSRRCPSPSSGRSPSPAPGGRASRAKRTTSRSSR